jgi:hypothetical protein
MLNTNRDTLDAIFTPMAPAVSTSGAPRRAISVEL